MRRCGSRSDLLAVSRPHELGDREMPVAAAAERRAVELGIARVRLRERPAHLRLSATAASPNEMRVGAAIVDELLQSADVSVRVSIRPDESLRALVGTQNDVAGVLARLVRLAGAHFL